MTLFGPTLIIFYRFWAKDKGFYGETIIEISEKFCTSAFLYSRNSGIECKNDFWKFGVFTIENRPRKFSSIYNGKFMNPDISSTIFKLSSSIQYTNTEFSMWKGRQICQGLLIDSNYLHRNQFFSKIVSSSVNETNDIENQFLGD